MGYVDDLKKMWAFAKEIIKRIDVRRFGPLDFETLPEKSELPESNLKAKKIVEFAKRDEDTKKLDDIYRALQEEFYVKTGEYDPYKAMELLKSPDFKLDLDGVPTRRLHVLKSFLKFDSKIPYPNRIRHKF